MDIKVCNKCFIQFPATNEYFTKNKARPFGLSDTCRECAAKIFAEKSDHLREYKKLYKEKNAERLKNYHQQYREKNRLLLRDKSKKYNVENREQVISRRKLKFGKDYYREYNRNYNKKHPLKVAIQSQKRRARYAKLERSFTEKQWDECLIYFKQKCAYCGKYDEKITQDHFIPVMKGGEYSVNNIVPACWSCNSSKRDRDFFEWYPKQICYNQSRQRKILKYLNYALDNTQQLTLTI